MRCYECGTSYITRTATLQQPYRYDLSGLKDAYLIGVTIKSCPSCKTESPVIPQLSGLHEVIAKSLVDKQGSLRGDEFRFLRKYGGFASKQFAALLDIDPSYLSRFENGKHKTLSGAVDKLARGIVTAAKNQAYTKSVLLHMADGRIEAKRAEKRSKTRTAPVFMLLKSGWSAAA